MQRDDEQSVLGHDVGLGACRGACGGSVVALGAGVFRMKRRGFLGFLGGAAVAGPSMVRQAAAATMADLNVTALSGGLAGLGYDDGPVPYGETISTGGHNEWALRNLAKLIGRTAEQHAYYRRRTNVHKLDPDLASYRSIALHQKIRLQRDRDYARDLEGERGYLEAHIAGWFDRPD